VGFGFGAGFMDDETRWTREGFEGLSCLAMDLGRDVKEVEEER